ncbi:helix-turn-helix domain-containing protein [Streptomyces profundus]|nr:helix-turn-helix domain-containing protein [Streptomyces sp. MA3_2.13]
MLDDGLPGERLREARRARGLTQEGLAERAGLSLGVVKKIERGGSARIETYHALARALGVRTSRLFESDPPHQERRGDDDNLMLLPLRQAIAPPVTGQGPLDVADGVDPVPDLAHIRAAADRLAEAYYADSYGTVAESLPRCCAPPTTPSGTSTAAPSTPRPCGCVPGSHRWPAATWSRCGPTTWRISPCVTPSRTPPPRTTRAEWPRRSTNRAGFSSDRAGSTKPNASRSRRPTSPSPASRGRAAPRWAPGGNCWCTPAAPPLATTGPRRPARCCAWPAPPVSPSATRPPWTPPHGAGSTGERSPTRRSRTR